MRNVSAMELLQRYRRDRRELLKYILTTIVFKNSVPQPGSTSLDDLDLDSVSVDYVLKCAKTGECVNLSEAVKQYYGELRFPPMAGDNFGRSYLLVSDPELSGPPPQRKPPPIASRSPSDTSPDCFPVDDDINYYYEDEEDNGSSTPCISRCPLNNSSDLVLFLPPFKSGLSSDELRETAYEVLLASVGASGALVLPNKEIKKERKPKFMRKLSRGKSGKHTHQIPESPGSTGILNIIRVQMEISEKNDLQIREGLHAAIAGHVSKRMDTLLLPLELLCSLSKANFSDKRSYTRWQKRQLKVLEEALLNNPTSGLDIAEGLQARFRALSATIEETEESTPLYPSKRPETLRALRRVAMELSGRAGVSHEVCHWADRYYLNVQLYEKLLCSVFDLLDEGKLMEESEEILELLKQTWGILGITQSIHDVCYAWALFHQFVMTGEASLLQQSILQMQKLARIGEYKENEWEYMMSFSCQLEIDDGYQEFSLLESFLLPIKKWCDEQLRDYHSLCPQELSSIDGIVMAAMLTRKLICEKCDQIQLARSPTTVAEAKQVEDYIISSTNTAYERALEAANAKFVTKRENPLKTLAETVMNIAQTDAKIFSPVFSHWNKQSGAISASLLHSLYGRELKPFLDGVTQLSDDVTSILSAADLLEQYLMDLVYSVEEEDENNESYRHGMSPYQVEAVSCPLLSQWIIYQHRKITEWVERCVQQEKWDCLSSQFCHGVSIVEVYRIMEETVDQIFNFNLPMRYQQLKLLCSGFDNALQLYSQNIIKQLGDKNDLVPPTPFLTRYKKDNSLNSFAKKKSMDLDSSEGNAWVPSKEWSTSKLCVRLNSLQYLLTQLNTLEENIHCQWSQRTPGKSFASDNIRSSSNTGIPTDKFSSVFDGTREIVSEAIDKLCEFTGFKIIFVDMRESFVEGLYKGAVSQARIENVINVLDSELRQVCDLIVDSLRDQVVTSLLQAALDAFVRVLLDGGPSRVFSQSDTKMLEEDLEMLKEFFMAGGDGLSSHVVENILEHVKQIIELYSLETHTVIEELLQVSENTNTPDSRRYGRRSPKESYTLLRVLCHRSDREASKFLKIHYRLPKSAGYDTTPSKEATFMESPFSTISGSSMTQLWKKSASFRLSEDSQRSFKFLKQKIHNATMEFKQGGW